MRSARSLTRSVTMALVALLVTTAGVLAQDRKPTPPAAGPADPNARTQAGAPSPGSAAPAPPPIDRFAAPWHDDPNIPPTQDPKALEILKAGLKALGGETAILGRKTIYIKRKCINHEYPEPREGTITIWFRRPDKFRKEVEYPGEKHVTVYDGKSAWVDDGKGARMLGPVTLASLLDGLGELDLPANYLTADLTYFNISQEIPGKLAHVVKVRQHGYTRELLFDVTTYLLQVSGEYENPWGATDKMLRFDRYRPVDGFMVPYRIEHWRANEIVLETEVLDIKFNGPIDDALFQLPAGQPIPPAAKAPASPSSSPPAPRPVP